MLQTNIRYSFSIKPFSRAKATHRKYFEKHQRLLEVKVQSTYEPCGQILLDLLMILIIIEGTREMREKISIGRKIKTEN